MSPRFWSLYLDPLLGQLREAGVGCHIAGLFVGVVGYADDLLLLAPSRDAAQKMLKTCEMFAEKNNIDRAQAGMGSPLGLPYLPGTEGAFTASRSPQQIFRVLPQSQGVRDGKTCS